MTSREHHQRPGRAGDGVSELYRRGKWRKKDAPSADACCRRFAPQQFTAALCLPSAVALQFRALGSKQRNTKDRQTCRRPAVRSGSPDFASRKDTWPQLARLTMCGENATAWREAPVSTHTGATGVPVAQPPARVCPPPSRWPERFIWCFIVNLKHFRLLSVGHERCDAGRVLVRCAGPPLGSSPCYQTRALPGH